MVELFIFPVHGVVGPSYFSDSKQCRKKWSCMVEPFIMMVTASLLLTAPLSKIDPMKEGEEPFTLLDTTHTTVPSLIINIGKEESMNNICIAGWIKVCVQHSTIVSSCVVTKNRSLNDDITFFHLYHSSITNS